MKYCHFLGILTVAPAACFAQPTNSGQVAVLDFHPWAMDHANAARTGSTSFLGPSIGVVEWSRKIGGMPPGIACDRSGRAILGATYYDEWWSEELYVQTYEQNGEISWRQKVTPTAWGGSQGVKSKPALNKQGEAVVNSGNGQLLKFDTEGSLLNTMQGNTNSLNDSAPAVLKDGTIVHYQFINLTKYAANGAQIWTRGCFSQSDPAIAPNGDVALGGVRTNEPHGSVDVSYFNSNGTLRWSKSSTNGTNTQVCFGSDGTLYTTVNGTTAYNPDGTVKWNTATGGWGVGLDRIGRALVPQGNKVYAYNRDTGAVIWTTTLPGSVVQGLTIDGANKIYASISDGYVVCIKVDGTILWNIKVCSQLYTQPSIAAGSALYVTGNFGFLDHALFRIK